MKTWQVPKGVAPGFTSDGRYLILPYKNAESGETDQYLTRLFDTSDSQNLFSYPYLSYVDNNTIRILSNSNGLEIWKIRPLRRIVQLSGLVIWEMCLDRRIAHIYDARTGRYLRTLQGFNAGVGGYAWAPSSRQLACVGMDHKIYIWNL